MYNVTTNKKMSSTEQLPYLPTEIMNLIFKIKDDMEIADGFIIYKGLMNTAVYQLNAWKQRYYAAYGAEYAIAAIDRLMSITPLLPHHAPHNAQNVIWGNAYFGLGHIEISKREHDLHKLGQGTKIQARFKSNLSSRDIQKINSASFEPRRSKRNKKTPQ